MTEKHLQALEDLDEVSRNLDLLSRKTLRVAQSLGLKSAANGSPDDGPYNKLKAEIAAIADRVSDDLNGNVGTSQRWLIDKLRQLSAV